MQGFVEKSAPQQRGQNHIAPLRTMTSNVPNQPILTRFGDVVDVRRRGALRLGRFAGTQDRSVDAPAVVRLWTDDQCRELSSHQARALAAQLMAAADLAEQQNGQEQTADLPGSLSDLGSVGCKTA